jgi:hypothetical protein
VNRKRQTTAEFIDGPVDTCTAHDRRR